MTARRRGLLAVALAALMVLCRVRVGVPLAGPVPAVAFLGCAELAALAFLAVMIWRSSRAYTVRTA